MKRIRHDFDPEDMDLTVVKRRVSFALGRQVEPLASWPEGDDDPASLEFEDEATGERVEVETAVVQQAITAARLAAAAEKPPTDATFTDVLTAFNSAADDAARWLAVKMLLEALAVNEQRRNEAAERQWTEMRARRLVARRVRPARMRGERPGAG